MLELKINKIKARYVNDYVFIRNCIDNKKICFKTERENFLV